MTRATRTSRPRRLVERVRSDETGASLLFALIFISVFAVVIAAVLSFVDSSMRNTVAARAQAAQASAADGAAQAAINNLRKGTFDGSTANCFGGSANLPLANFYPAAGGYSATVSCEVDTTDSGSTGGVTVSTSNRPGAAILTLGTAAGEDGLNLSANGGRTILVHGTIASNSNINVGVVNTNAAVLARGHCVGTITSTPARQCDQGAAAVNTLYNDPGYAKPTAAATPQTVPPCQGDNRLVTFSPGLYNDLAALNALTDGSCKGIFNFTPGVYYFNLGGIWTLRSGSVIGGTLTSSVVNGTRPTMPGTCKTPIPPDGVDPSTWDNPGPNAGVEFVFGGTTQLYLNKGQLELCGSYSSTTPPIAIYGLKSAASGVPAQNGCTVVVGGAGCDVITSDNSPSSKMFIQGTTYLPATRVNIQLNNNTGQVFRYGIIARSLEVGATGSADLSGPVIEVPDFVAADALTVLYLKVYVCKGSAACATTGTPALKVKVGLLDSGGSPVAGAREVTVYNWSNKR